MEKQFSLKIKLFKKNGNKNLNSRDICCLAFTVRGIKEKSWIFLSFFLEK